MQLTGVIAFFLFIAGLTAGFLLFQGKPVNPVVIHQIDSVLVDRTRPERDSLKTVAARAERQVKHWKAVADQAHSEVEAALARSDSATALAASQNEAGDLRVALDREMARSADLLANSKLADDRIESLTGSLEKARAALAKVRVPRKWGVGCTAGLGLKGIDAVCGVTIHL